MERGSTADSDQTAAAMRQPALLRASTSPQRHARTPSHAASQGQGLPGAATSSQSTAAGVSTAATPASAAHGAGATIIVRHTRRPSTHRSQPSISGAAGDALARQAAAAAAALNSPDSLESVRAHYEPLLAAKEARRDDLQQRLRKQETRLHAMTAWKVRALDKAASEPDPLDFVLSPDGSGHAVQSVRVRQMRLVLQRLVVRQFIRTARVMRSLRMVARQMRATLPLLLHSPNSNISPQDADDLRALLDEWNREPAPIASRQPLPPASSPSTLPRPSFALDAPPPSLPPPPPPASASAGADASDGFFPSAHVEASRKALDSYYRQRPHAVVGRLLSSLARAVPLVSSSVRSNLHAQSSCDRACESQLKSNSSRWESIQSTLCAMESRREKLRLLREDVAAIEAEMHDQRAEFTRLAQSLESNVRREANMHRKLNRIYYQEVAAQLGDDYAMQLARVQQGHADWASQQPQQQQQQSSSGNYARPSPSSSIPAAGAAHAHAHARQASSLATTAAGDVAGSPTNSIQLFLPSTLLGTNLPPPPPILPTFLSAGGSASTSGSGSGSSPSVATIPLTPFAPLSSCTRLRPVDRTGVLAAVQNVLDQHPQRKQGERGDEGKEHGREEAKTHMHSQTKHAAQKSASRPAPRSTSDSDAEDDSDAEGDAHAHYAPFFVLHGDDDGSNPPRHYRGRSGRSNWTDEGRGASDEGDADGAERPDEEEEEDESDEQIFSIHRTHARRGRDSHREDEVDEEHQPEQQQRERADEQEEQGEEAQHAEEEKPAQQASQPSPAPGHERNDSSTPLPPSLLSPPARPLAPLHARTLSEIDWNASGSAPSPAQQAQARRRHLSTDERAAQEHQRSLTNPHPMWQLTAEQARALVEEAEAEDDSSPEQEQSRAKSTASAQTQAHPQAQPTTPAHPIHGRTSSATPGAWGAHPASLTASASHAVPSSSPATSRRPASAAAHVYRNNSGAVGTATSFASGAHVHSSVGSADGLPPSPIPGLSAAAYASSFRIAVAHLRRMGYPEQQARDFAPQVILVGAIPLPSDEDEQERARAGEEAQLMLMQQQQQQQQRGRGSSRVLGYTAQGRSIHVRSASTQSARPHSHSHFISQGAGAALHAATLARGHAHARTPSQQQQQQQQQQAHPPHPQQPSTWVHQSAGRLAPYVHARAPSHSGPGAFSVGSGGGAGVMSARPASARPANQQQPAQQRPGSAAVRSQGHEAAHPSSAPRHRVSASVSLSARSSSGSSSSSSGRGSGGGPLRPSSAVGAARTDALVAGLPTTIATYIHHQPTPPPDRHKHRPASARTAVVARTAPLAITDAGTAVAAAVAHRAFLQPSPPTTPAPSDPAPGFLLSPS